MAQKKEFFKEAGLDVEFVPLVSDTDLIRALLAHDIDSMEAYPGSALVAIDHGARLKILGGYLTGVPHVLYVRDNINSAKDLEGKRVAVSAPGDLPQILPMAYMLQNGADPAKVNWVTLGRDSARFQSLVVGKIDATASNIDFLPLLAGHRDLKVLVRFSQVLPKFLRLTVITLTETLERRTDDITKFSIRYGKGVRYAIAHRDETIALMGEIVKGLDPSAGGLIFDTFLKERLIEPDFYISPSQILFMEQLNILTGRQKQRLPVAQVATYEIQRRVIGALGQYRWKGGP
jgi:NitT/TauT family transport system substrate-binding protein